MEYAVIYHKTRTGYSAGVPDLPGCVATGKTLAQTKQRMRKAIALHIRGMKEDGEPIPEPVTVGEMVKVDLNQ